MTPKKRILVVDDEPHIVEYISENLSARGFDVSVAGTGLEALAYINTVPPDLVILDIMMPHMDGLETCRRIRQSSIVPIIVLSALGEEADKVRALDMGADDYLTKPLSVDELMARVRAHFRRATWFESDQSRESLAYKELEISLVKNAVTLRGEVVNFTRMEFSLLHYLLQNIGTVLTHQQILDQIWGVGNKHQPEYLRVYIGRLRRKIEHNPSEPEYLHSVYGVGYRFGEAPVTAPLQ